MENVTPFRRTLIALAVVLIAASAFVWGRLDAVAKIAGGYKAKIACSEIFLAGRAADAVIAREFENMDPAMNMFRVRVSKENRSVKTSGPVGLGRAEAVFRDGYGCTLTHGGEPAALPALPAPAKGAAFSTERDADVSAIIDEAFADEAAGHRAILVLRNGVVIAERHADGFRQDTPFLSWSMAKSVTATLVGAAIADGLIDIDAPAPVPEWRDDPVRSAITWRDLLQMQSGLAFEEDYGTATSDVNVMLFRSRDTGAVAAKKTLAHEPGTHWSYSSGTTNLLARTLRGVLESNGREFPAFARNNLFSPLGAASVVMEPDASGVFIGSSFMYATAQDWARLGQLYMQDGVWNGERLLPAGWTDFVAEPAAASDGRYGGQFWLNRDGSSGRQRDLPALPEDMYYMSGHEGQYVFIVPSTDIIIVRLGVTRGVESSFAANAPLMERIYIAATAADA